jgi:RsiW-degrading membrane proteinase PrsW (M82 family)
MIYAENIFLCIAAPLLIGLLLLRGETRRFIGFFGLGILACLLATYVNGYVAVLVVNDHASLSAAQIMVQVTPICEELMKALPVFIFAAVTLPRRRDIVAVALAVGLGFATFENICYLAQYGAQDMAFVLIRGFSAGVIHAVCAALLGYGYAALHKRGRLVVPGAFALLCLSATYHGIYNLLVMAGGAWQTAGYILPLLTAGVILFFVLLKGNGFRSEPES